MQDVIGFSTYINEDKIRRFGVRGVGPSYEKFYKWLNTKKTIDDYSDWPWHYFSLSQQDEAELLEMIKNNNYYLAHDID